MKEIQCYIDGGIFLMNLLYALHFKNIAACPLHCALNLFKERKIKKMLGMKRSETDSSRTSRYA